MANIRIDDGTREYTIENNYGETIATIHLRPADTSLLDRYNDFKNGFDEIVAPLKEIEITSAGEAAEDEGLEKLREAEKRLIEGLEKVTDSKDLKNIFKTRAPFSSIKGHFFCENVMQAIGDIINTAVAEEVEASNERMKKYLRN